MALEGERVPTQMWMAVGEEGGGEAGGEAGGEEGVGLEGRRTYPLMWTPWVGTPNLIMAPLRGSGREGRGKGGREDR